MLESTMHDQNEIINRERFSHVFCKYELLLYALLYICQLFDYSHVQLLSKILQIKKKLHHLYYAVISPTYIHFG